MKLLLAQPALKRFEWELDTLLTNINDLNWDIPVVLLFTEDDMSVVEHFKNRYPNLEIHHYADGRIDKSYPPTTRPYLIWCYLSEDSTRESEDYFQIESDIIFREIPDLKELAESGVIYGSDCGGYIDYEYLRTRKQGDTIIDTFASILAIDRKVIEQTPGIGAHWIYMKPTAQLWWHIWQDCDRLWHYLEPLDSDIQKWTAEMWSQLYNFRKFGWEAEILPELEFCRPTDGVKMWDTVKILHNAGVIGEGAAGLLYKGKYITESPFNEDLSWVRRDKCGWHYAKAVDRAAGKT